MNKVNMDNLDDISRQKMLSIHNGRQSGSYSVKVFKTNDEYGERAQMPVYKTVGSSGADLHAAEEVVIEPMSGALVRTGLIFQCPNIRWEVQIRSRSGLALKKNIFVLNSPGTIDSDYIGGVGVILFNLGKKPFRVEVGDRIAQAVICKMQAVCFEEGDGEPSSTTRGEGGFGSTGV